MTSRFAAICLLSTLLPVAGCVAMPGAAVPATTIADAPLQLIVRAPGGDGLVGLTLTVRVVGGSQYRFFLRSGVRDDEIKVEPRGETDFVWDAKGLAAGVYSLWASAYTDSGRFLGASPLTNLVLTPANAATLPPIRGGVRDAP